MAGLGWGDNMPGYVSDIPLGTLSGIEGSSQSDPGIQKVKELMAMLESVLKPPQQPQPIPGMTQFSDNPWGRWVDNFGRGAANLFGGGEKIKDADLKRRLYLNQMAGYQDQQANYESSLNQGKQQILLEAMRGDNRIDVMGMRNQERKLRLIPTTIVKDGVPTRVVDVFDPITNQYLGRHDQGDAGYAPFVQPAIPGLSGPTIIPKTVQPGGGVREVGNIPPPPQGIVRDLALDKASLEAIDKMKSAYMAIRAKTSKQSLIGKIGRDFVGQTKYGGALSQTKDYASYASTMRNSLNAYIKAQTGAQFSVVEMDRYTALYPEPWDPEDLAATKIDNLRQRALADMREKLRNYPAAVENPDGSDPVEDALREWEAKRANPTQ